MSRGNTNQVTIYVAHDQDYAQPVLEAFEKKTGVKVNAVYDTEASKTVGLTNRLIAEKGNPQADAFWNNEVTRTIQLKKENVLQPYTPQNANQIADVYKDSEGYWTGFAARARVLVINKDKLTEAAEPKTLESLTSIQFKDHVTIADPRAGTTGSHIASLFAVWGPDSAKQYLKDLKTNGLNVAQSNGQTRDKVVNGEEWIGFTDTDDANDAITEGKPVRVVYPDQGAGEIGTLVIPNTIMMIKGAKREEAAKQLIDYLISAEVESKLAYAKSAQMPLLPNVDKPANVPDVSTIKPMQVTWDNVYTQLQPALDFVEQELLK